ncbi:hypothetical protein [Falsiroseomonas sp. HW251]|uniref:hypothetical protein n=1 Tax=Falsiroseomonas sp. HW251 TaxID=3390998 RepID=UPI003D321B3C
MPQKFSPIANFVAGMPRAPAFGYLVFALDDLSERQIPHSVLAFWVKGKFGEAGQTGWHTAGIAVLTQPRECAVAVGGGGQSVAFGPPNYKVDERIGAPGDGPANRGPLRGVRTIADRVYAVGMDRQAYIRVGERDWRPMQQGLTGTPPGQTSGFEAVDGYSAEEIYAVGWDGEIWQWDGSSWTRQESPTNLILTDVCCAGDGQVYACGRQGLLLRGRGPTWTIVEQDVIDEDIWSLAWFGEALYLATFEAVYVMRGDTIEMVDFGEGKALSTYRLGVGPASLWSVGAKDVMSFDGTSWTRID